MRKLLLIGLGTALAAPVLAQGTASNSPPLPGEETAQGNVAVTI